MELNKSVASMAVEKALLEMGKLELDMVVSRLKKDFDLNLLNCLYHPEPLKQILCELFGDSYTDILSSIDESFKKLTIDIELDSFLRVLKK